MSGVPDPLPAAVRRYLQAARSLSVEIIDARIAMSIALSQHGKVEALHAAAVALADDMQAELGGPADPRESRVVHVAYTRGHELVRAYRAAKAALAESNQEAGGDSSPAGDNAESAGHALRRSDPETGTVPPASPSAAAITAAETLLNSSASEIHSYDRKVFGVVCLGDAREIVRNAVHAAETAAREAWAGECGEFADELRKWWSFNDEQGHTHTWHAREDFIGKVLPKLLAAILTRRAPGACETCAGIESLAERHITFEISRIRPGTIAVWAVTVMEGGGYREVGTGPTLVAAVAAALRGKKET